MTPADRRRLWSLGVCGLLLAAAVVAFNLLYLFVPRGWTPYHGFASEVGAAAARWLRMTDVAFTPRSFARISAGLQIAMWAAFLGAVYLASRLRASGARRPAFGLVIGLGALAALALLLTPPALSADFYRYALFGRMIVVHHLNPYVTPASALAADPLLPLASWPDLSSHYGPVFTDLSVVAAWVGAGSPIGTTLALKGVAVAGGVLTAWAAASLAEREGRDGLLPLVLVAWNPLALLETAGSGHNELLMTGLALAGVLVMRGGRTMRGFLLLLASIQVKWITAALAGLAALAHLRDTRGAPARARALASFLGLAVAVTAALWAPFWTGLGSLAAIRLHMFDPGHNDPSKAGLIGPINFVLFAIVAAIATALVLRKGRPVVLDAAAMISLAFATFIYPWVFPWYLLPAVVLLAPGPVTRLNGSLLIVVTAASMFLMAFWAVLVPR